MWPIIIIVYFIIAILVSLFTFFSDPYDDVHLLIGLWWPILLAKEIWKSFKIHVLEK